MSIFVIGINHKTASIALREKMYFSDDKIPLYLQDLKGRELVEEAVLLSTCNRSELYCTTRHIEAVCNWFRSQHESVDVLEFNQALYVYTNEKAVRHLMEVACGLDSMVLGEPQIFGQLKEAFAESCAMNAISTLFHRLFQQTFMIAKDIRTTTAIGACPVSVASASIKFAKEKVSDFKECNIVLLGAGETTKLLLSHLKEVVKKPITIVNRHVENAWLINPDQSHHVFSLSELPFVLQTADIVFSATGSPTPIITKTMVEGVLLSRDKKPLLLIDIAVPRDIEPSITALDAIQLYCIDDLKSIIENNRLGREHAAVKAKEMVREKSKAFVEELALHDKVTHTIRSYRSQIEEIGKLELVKAKQQLKQGADPVMVLDMFLSSLTKKLLHTPSVQLRQAGIEGRVDLLRFAKQLFAIPDTEVEQA